MKNATTIWIGLMIILGLCSSFSVFGFEALATAKNELLRYDEGVQPLEKDYTGYKVELIRTATELKRTDPLFEQFGNIRLETRSKENLPYAYLIGDFSKWKSANDFMGRVIESRFPNAKVIQFENGTRVDDNKGLTETAKSITEQPKEEYIEEYDSDSERLSMVVDKIEKPKEVAVITIAPKATAKRTNRTTRISFSTPKPKPEGTAKSPEPKEELVATVAKKEKVKSKTKAPKKVKAKPTKKPKKVKVRPKEVITEVATKPKEKPIVQPAEVKKPLPNSKKLKRVATINTLPEKYDGYKVLLLETDEELDSNDPLFKEFGNLTLEYLPDNEKPYQYLIGDFDNWDGTEKFMELVITPRFPDAKVIKYRKGKRKKKNAFDY